MKKRCERNPNDGVINPRHLACTFSSFAFLLFLCGSLAQLFSHVLQSSRQREEKRKIRNNNALFHRFCQKAKNFLFFGDFFFLQRKRKKSLQQGWPGLRETKGNDKQKKKKKGGKMSGKGNCGGKKKPSPCQQTEQ